MAKGDIHDDVGWGTGGDPFDTAQTTHGTEPDGGEGASCALTTITLAMIAVFLMVMASKKVVFPKVIVRDKR